MDNQFIEDTKKRQRYGLKKEEQRAYESIIDFLFKMRLRGKEKARQLDEFDGETLFGANTLYPSQIYAFIYEAKNPSTYRFNGKEFKFTDRLPIVQDNYNLKKENKQLEVYIEQIMTQRVKNQEKLKKLSERLRAKLKKKQKE